MRAAALLNTPTAPKGPLQQEPRATPWVTRDANEFTSPVRARQCVTRALRDIDGAPFQGLIRLGRFEPRALPWAPVGMHRWCMELWGRALCRGRFFEVSGDANNQCSAGRTILCHGLASNCGHPHAPHAPSSTARSAAFTVPLPSRSAGPPLDHAPSRIARSAPLT